LAKERKEALKKEARAAKRQKTGTTETGQTSGIEVATPKRKHVSIAECNDLKTLQEMLE